MGEVREIDDRLWKRLMKRKAEDLCFIFGDETPDVISDYVKRRKLVAREERAEPPDRREVTEEASIRRSLSPNYVDDPNARINELEPEKNAREEREEPPERREVAEEPSIRRPPSLNYEDDTDALIKELAEYHGYQLSPVAAAPIASIVPEAHIAPNEPADRQNGSVEGEREDIAEIQPSTNISFDEACNRTVQHVFGYNSPHEHQMATLLALQGKKDVILCTTTGSGKSLPGLIFGRAMLDSRVHATGGPLLTVIFYPYAALRNDQMIRAQTIEQRSGQKIIPLSSNSVGYKDTLRTAFAEGKMTDTSYILMTTAEMLEKDQQLSDIVTQISQEGRLALVVVDEAHVFGRDARSFRPAMRTVGEARRGGILSNCQYLFLTATISEEEERELCTFVGLRGLYRKIGGEVVQADRHPNLKVEVRKFTSDEQNGRLKDVSDVVDEMLRVPGKILVFTRSIAESDELAANLKGLGVPAESFNSRIVEGVRDATFDKWMDENGDTKVIVATSMLQCGIDNPLVTGVVCCGMPRSLSDLKQQIGRGGRDGRRARAVVFYSDADFGQLRRELTFYKSKPQAVQHAYKKRKSAKLNATTGARIKGGSALTLEEQNLLDENRIINETAIDESFRLKWALDEQDLCLRAMMGYKTVFVDTWRANCNGDSIDFSAVYNRCPAESFFKCDNCRRAEEIGEAVGNFNAGPHVQSITAMIQEAKVADPPIRLNVPTIASIYRGDKNTVGFKKVKEFVDRGGFASTYGKGRELSRQSVEKILFVMQSSGVLKSVTETQHFEGNFAKPFPIRFIDINREALPLPSNVYIFCSDVEAPRIVRGLRWYDWETASLIKSILAECVNKNLSNPTRQIFENYHTMGTSVNGEPSRTVESCRQKFYTAIKSKDAAIKFGLSNEEAAVLRSIQNIPVTDDDDELMLEFEQEF